MMLSFTFCVIVFRFILCFFLGKATHSDPFNNFNGECEFQLPLVTLHDPPKQLEVNKTIILGKISLSCHPSFE